MTNQSLAQAQTSTTTGVFVLLKPKSGVTRDQVMAIMPAEIRATVQLYLDGKIREWYARRRSGSRFSAEHERRHRRRSIMEALPLAKEHLVDEEYIPVGPLTPLRLLMASPSVKQ